MGHDVWGPVDPYQAAPQTHAPANPGLDYEFSSHNNNTYLATIVLIIVIIIVIFILLFQEHADHDCIPGKHCRHYVPPPTGGEDVEISINKLQAMAHSNYDIVTWRQALLMALIIPPLIIYYLKGRLPTPLEWFIVGLFVFLAVYLSYSWVWAHFFHPNGKAIEEGLEKLRQKYQYGSE